MTTETAHFTDAQREAARNGYDPDHLLDDDELYQTAIDGLWFAAAELRALSERLLAHRDRLRASPTATTKHTRMAGLEEAAHFARSRADELDPSSGEA